MHRLRDQADVGADRDAALLQKGGGIGHKGAAFEFDDVSAGLHQLGGGGKGLLAALLVGSEGQVGNDHRVAVAAGDGGGVVAHLGQGNGQGGITPLYGHAQRVAHQQGIDAGAVHQRGEAGFVAGEHGDFFAGGFHFLQGGDGNHGADSFIICGGAFQAA